MDDAGAANGHWKTTTFIAALRHNGVTAPFVLDGRSMANVSSLMSKRCLLQHCRANPIEMMFSKLKTLLRRASERSIEALWNRIGELLDRFPQNECENYFKAAGYEPT
jgi:hypothetical protein